MPTLVLDPHLEEWLKSSRIKTRACYYDEVWDEVYVVTPPFDNEHQELKGDLQCVLSELVARTGTVLFGGVVSDRGEDWANNFRLPDASVVLTSGMASLSRTHCVGGPDFVAEIMTPGDRSREKLDFYSQIGVRELLLVDRDPWQLELYRLASGGLELIGSSEVNKPAALTSIVVPTSFRLVPGTPRPRIEVTHNDGVQRWLV